jgi:FAD-dependent urate hydroxylase
MHTWRTGMPEGTALNPEGLSLNLWHLDGAFTLKDDCVQQGLPYKDSGRLVRLKTSSDYGVAFQRHVVPMLDTRWVKSLNLENNISALRSHDSGIVMKKRVVVAAGIRNFYLLTHFFQPLGHGT